MSRAGPRFAIALAASAAVHVLAVWWLLSDDVAAGGGGRGGAYTVAIALTDASSQSANAATQASPSEVRLPQAGPDVPEAPPHVEATATEPPRQRPSRTSPEMSPDSVDARTERDSPAAEPPLDADGPAPSDDLTAPVPPEELPIETAAVARQTAPAASPMVPPLPGRRPPAPPTESLRAQVEPASAASPTPPPISAHEASTTPTRAPTSEASAEELARALSEPDSSAAADGASGLNTGDEVERGVGAGDTLGVGPGVAESYIAVLQAWLARHKRYPAAARRGGVEGTAILSFAIAADGTVTAYALVRSSGSGLLDRAVASLIQSASPVPPIPPALGVDRLEVSVPVSYRLQ